MSFVYHWCSCYRELFLVNHHREIICNEIILDKYSDGKTHLSSKQHGTIKGRMLNLWTIPAHGTVLLVKFWEVMGIAAAKNGSRDCCHAIANDEKDL